MSKVLLAEPFPVGLIYWDFLRRKESLNLGQRENANSKFTKTNWYLKKNVSKFLLAYKVIILFKECDNNIKKTSFQVIEEPSINPTYAWGFFVRALEGTPSSCRGGSILYLDQHRHFILKYEEIKGTNNNVEDRPL